MPRTSRVGDLHVAENVCLLLRLGPEREHIEQPIRCCLRERAAMLSAIRTAQFRCMWSSPGVNKRCALATPVSIFALEPDTQAGERRAFDFRILSNMHCCVTAAPLSSVWGSSAAVVACAFPVCIRKSASVRR